MTDRLSSYSPAETAVPAAGDWVAATLLAGDPADICMWIGKPVSRAGLLGLVGQQQQQLEAAGLGPGGTVTLHLPPSLAEGASLREIYAEQVKAGEPIS